MLYRRAFPGAAARLPVAAIHTSGNCANRAGLGGCPAPAAGAAASCRQRDSSQHRSCRPDTVQSPSHPSSVPDAREGDEDGRHAYRAAVPHAQGGEG